MAVTKEYKFEGATVRIHDDCLLKDQNKIQEILDEIAKIYARAYERKMTEGASWMRKMKFNMDRAMRNLGYLTMLSALMLGSAKILVDMIGRVCN